MTMALPPNVLVLPSASPSPDPGNNYSVIVFNQSIDLMAEIVVKLLTIMKPAIMQCPKSKSVTWELPVHQNQCSQYIITSYKEPQIDVSFAEMAGLYKQVRKPKRAITGQSKLLK